MDPFFQEYLAVLVFIVIACGLSLVMVLGSYLVGAKKARPRKIIRL